MKQVFKNFFEEKKLKENEIKILCDNFSFLNNFSLIFVNSTKIIHLFIYFDRSLLSFLTFYFFLRHFSNQKKAMPKNF